MCFKNILQKYYRLCDIAIKIFWKKKKTCRNRELSILTGLQIWTEITTFTFCLHSTAYKILYFYYCTFCEDISYILICLLLKPNCNLHFCYCNHTLVSNFYLNFHYFRYRFMSSSVKERNLSTKLEIRVLTNVIEMTLLSKCVSMHLFCLFSALKWI